MLYRMRLKRKKINIHDPPLKIIKYCGLVESGHRNFDIGISTMSNFQWNFVKMSNCTGNWTKLSSFRICRNSSGITTISIFADDFIVQYPMEFGQHTFLLVILLSNIRWKLDSIHHTLKTK
jgi:hypothetical protein